MSQTTDLVTPDNVTIEMIRDIYDAAFMEATLDEEKKQIRIREEVLARAFLAESKERLQLVAYYGIKEDAQRIDRLELVNRVNENYVLIRAGIDDDGDLWFDYCVLLKGGVTKKAIVQATRVFLMLVPRAVNECDEDGIVD
ncbi:YbjN domain-containing protein [Fimbriiglobus ruber]|uniref:Osmotic signal transduction related protein n=1 Tax=Fimbriiglobus ruber TaxID=1908690 RepID=A0A225DJN3_9BACT|nr:YbjN domain-containing protein [Fimbriiglobus ruber]OWK41670.1 Osmotic signal transduction related protein [Fimbriiglobus ruber]